MILWFSGNGHTRHAALLLAGLLHTSHEQILKLAEPTCDRTVIWMMPVHSWGPPLAVADAIRKMSRAYFPSHAIHHLVLLCGDDCGEAHHIWRKLITDKGWLSGSEWSVQAPNTYVLLPGFDVDKPSVNEAKMQAMEPKLQEIAREIASGTTGITDIVTGSMPRLKSRLVYPAFRRWGNRPSKFHVTDACISCGMCVRTCPLNNVRPDSNGRPVWGSNCTQCLGCYNVCPRHAVAYGKITGHKGQCYLR